MDQIGQYKKHTSSISVIHWSDPKQALFSETALEELYNWKCLPTATRWRLPKVPMTWSRRSNMLTGSSEGLANRSLCSTAKLNLWLSDTIVPVIKGRSHSDVPLVSRWQLWKEWETCSMNMPDCSAKIWMTSNANSSNWLGKNMMTLKILSDPVKLSMVTQHFVPIWQFINNEVLVRATKSSQESKPCTHLCRSTESK